MSKNNSWKLDVQQDKESKDYYILLNDEILEASGFKVGDDLEWVDNKDGSYTLKKIEKKTVWVMVDCINMFRQRYCVEVPADHPEYALDTVTCEEAEDFSQSHIGEQIVSHRVVSEEEMLRMCDEDNDYGKGWSKELKIKNFCTPENHVLKHKQMFKQEK